MADIRYTGEFVDQISPKLKNLQQEVGKTNTSFSGMARVLGAVTAAISTRQIIEYTSTWTDLNSKFRNAVGDAGAARTALEAIGRTAQSTFTSLEQTAETFLRNSQTLKELGFTTSEQVNLSEALNNALAVSGTKGQEAESVMNALSRSFANGNLSGQNFNTVLQSGGRITQALADGLGVTTLELRAMATAGKLETGVVIEALTSQMQRLRDEADAMPATIKDAFVVLNNSIGQFVGTVDEATGTSEALANILVKLSAALDAISENATTIQRIVIVLRELVVIGGVLLSVFVAFRVVKAVFFALVAIFRNIGAVIATLIGSVKALGGAFASIGNTVRQFFGMSSVNRGLLKKELDSIGGPTKQLGALFNDAKGKLLAFGAGVPVLGAAIAGVATIIDRAKNAINDWNNASSGAKEAQKALAEESGAAARAVKAEEDRVRALSQARTELSQKISDNINSYSENNQMMLEAMKIRNQQIGMDEEQIRLTNALLTNERNFFREFSAIQKEIVKLSKEANEAENSLDRDKAAQAVKMLQEQQRELGRVYRETGVAVRDLVVQESELLKVQAQRTESQNVNRALDAAVKQNKLLTEGIALETAKLRLSESQREVVDQMFSLEQARLQAIEPLLQRINELKLNGSRADQELIPILEAGIGRINQQYGEQVNILNELLTKKEEELRLNSLNEFTRKQQMDIERQLQKIQDDTAKLTMTEIERKYFDIAAAARDSAKAAIEAEAARRGSPLSAAEEQEFFRVAKENAEKLAEATRKHNEQSRTWSTGWKKAYKEYADNAGNAARTAENVFKKSTQGMEDAIVNFAKTGKFEWKGFVNSILEELLRAQVRQLIAKTFNIGGLGGGGGGGGGGSNSLFGGFFATGGMIPAGRFGVVGESGPELVQGPANVTPMTPSNITYNINAVDAMSFKQMVASDPSFLFAVTEQGRRSLPQSRR